MDTIDGKPIPEKLHESSIRRRREQAKRKGELFIRGPIPLWWMAKAYALPGKAMGVGALLWFCHGIKGGGEFRLAPSRVREFGVSRSTLSRSLQSLEDAKLISIDRHQGRAPVIRIVVRRPSKTRG